MSCVFNGRDLPGVSGCMTNRKPTQETAAALLLEAKTAFSVPWGIQPLPQCCFRVSGACRVSSSAVRCTRAKLSFLCCNCCGFAVRKGCYSSQSDGVFF